MNWPVARKILWYGFLVLLAAATVVAGAESYMSTSRGCAGFFDPSWVVLPAAAICWLAALVRSRRRDSVLCSAIGSLAGTVLLAWLIVVAFLGPAACASSDFTRQRFTMKDMRTAGVLVERYVEHHGAPPEVSTIYELRSALAPIGACPDLDGWGNPFGVGLVNGQLQIVSAGRCGEFDPAEVWDSPGPTAAHEADIVWRNGDFIRYPEGTQR